MKKLSLMFIFLLLFAFIKISIAEPPEPPPLPPPISFPESGSESLEGNAPEAGSGGSSPGEGNVPEPGLSEKETRDADGVDGGRECKPCNEAIQEYIIESRGKDIFFKLSIILNLILIVLNSILVILLLKFLLQYRKNETNNGNIQQQSNQKAASVGLKSYIKNYLDKGYNPETIRRLLLKNNFSEETVNNAFNELKDGNRKIF